jgi:DHA3 family macrolide efflux protein-like MFS transporter
MLRAVRDPAIGRLWGALALSALADQSFTVVLSWVAVAAFGAAAGYLAVLQGAIAMAVVMGLGHLADRVAPLRLMGVTLLLRAAALGAVVAAWVWAGQPVGWVLVLAVVVLAAGMALFRPALQGALPGLARDPTLLAPANALLDTTDRIARLLGPGLLGLMAGLVPLAAVVGLEMAAFIAAAVVVAGLARRFPVAPARAERERMATAVARGFAAVRRHELLFLLLLMTAPMNGAWYAAMFLGTPLIIEAAGLTAGGGSGLAAFGLVFATYGGANLAATLVVGNLGQPRRPGVLILSGYAVLGAGIVGMGAAALVLPPDWLLLGLLAGAALSGAGAPMMDVPTATLRQTALARGDIPAAVRAFMVVNHLGLLGVLAVAPMLFERVGPAVGVALCGGVITLQGVWTLARGRGGPAADRRTPPGPPPPR